MARVMHGFEVSRKQELVPLAGPLLAVGVSKVYIRVIEARAYEIRIRLNIEFLNKLDSE